MDYSIKKAKPSSNESLKGLTTILSREIYEDLLSRVRFVDEPTLVRKITSVVISIGLLIDPLLLLLLRQLIPTNLRIDKSTLLSSPKDNFSSAILTDNLKPVIL
jgi:hypothetical protein